MTESSLSVKKCHKMALGHTQSPVHLLLGAKRRRREADHLPPTCVEIKNTWVCTSTLLYAFLPSWSWSPHEAGSSLLSVVLSVMKHFQLSGILPEKLVVAQLVSTLLAFRVNQRPVTILLSVSILTRSSSLLSSVRTLK